MSLYLYNTMSGKKELFEPLVPDTVTMYVCGPTVYNLAHIGNARPVVVFDTLFRLLQTHFSTVTYARNITDVDDKIIARAEEWREIGVERMVYHRGWDEQTHARQWDDEDRVVIRQLIDMGFSVAVEAGAGAAASFADEAYAGAGCEIAASAEAS